jgi:diketogulonate reductase-like aldo/keto reductase
VSTIDLRRTKLHRFGCTRRNVPVIGQGTWFIDRADRARAIAAVRRGVDLGMTHIDTAEMYGDAERVIAQAIRGRRDEVFLVSKVLPDHATRRGTLQACERSLARLETDRLDCYLLHWRGEQPLAETVAAFDQLRREGKILAWGVSNFDVPDLEELAMIADGDCIACNQVLYHLKERAIEHAVLPWCEQHDIAVVAYAPFGHGEFVSPRTAAGRILAEIAAAHRATPRKVGLAFLTRRPSLFAIPKAASPRHVEENAGAGALRLSREDVDRIDRAFPLGPRPDGLPMI